MEKSPERPSGEIAFPAIESGMLAGLWHVPVGGFEWRDDLRPAIVDGRVQVDDPQDRSWWLVARGEEARRYPVLARTNLARDFAELGRDPTRVAISRFANRYGHLGDSTWLKSLRDTDTDPIAFQLGGRNADWGESLDLWASEARTFWYLWDTWEHAETVATPDRSTSRQVDAARRELEARFGWSDNGAIWYRVDIPGAISGGGVISHPSESDYSQISAHIPKGDLGGLARFWVMKRVNEKLRGRVNATILPFRGAEVRFVPENLRAAIYLRFSLEISEGIGRIRECRGCSRPFTPRRRDQDYCDKNCRERAGYRRRTGGPGTERDLPA